MITPDIGFQREPVVRISYPSGLRVRLESVSYRKRYDALKRVLKRVVF